MITMREHPICSYLRKLLQRWLPWRHVRAHCLLVLQQIVPLIRQNKHSWRYVVRSLIVNAMA
jgi:hypothetical protein